MKLISIVMATLIVTLSVNEAAVLDAETDTDQKYPVTLSEELISFTKETAEDYEMDYRLVLAVMYYESKFQEHIYNYSKTCVGLMQVTVKYQKWLSEETGISNLDLKHNSEHNITAGIWMLADAMSDTDDVRYALMTYNRGAKGASDYMKKYRTYNTYAKKVYEIYEYYCDTMPG